MQDGMKVFIVKLGSSGNGLYEFELFRPIDHSESVLTSLSFSAIAQDCDGDRLPINFSINISEGTSLASLTNSQATKINPSYSTCLATMCSTLMSTPSISSWHLPRDIFRKTTIIHFPTKAILTLSAMIASATSLRMQMDQPARLLRSLLNFYLRMMHRYFRVRHKGCLSA